MSDREWQSVTKSDPCPACGKPDWCAWTQEGWLKCERTNNAPFGMTWVSNKESGAMFKPDDDPKRIGVFYGPPKRESGNRKADAKTFPTAREAVSDLEGRYGPRSAVWTYTDADGDPVGMVVRWDLPPDPDKPNLKPGKDILPVSKTRDGWANVGMAKPRPLYGLPALLATPRGTRVYVNEGEKKADEVRALGLVATASPHGSNSAAKADWSPLAGQDVVIVIDHDEHGEGYGSKVSKLALEAGAKSVRIVRLIDIWSSIPVSGDAVDFIKARRAAGAGDGDIKAEIEKLADEATLIEDDGDNLSSVSSLPSLKSHPWPDSLDESALHGLAGDIVRAIEPHSEADPAALLIDLLVSYGNMIGRNSYFVADGALHYPNLFAVMVGSTAKGRKGTARAQIRNVVEPVEPVWSSDCVQAGLSSGEGLIWAVRDPVFKSEQVKDRGKVTGDHQDIQIDEGVADKRLLVTEGEFASVLRVAGRDGNTLSPIVREAWDKGDLRTLTKNNPAKATGAHISIIGHITDDELRRYLNNTEAANGFANRFIWQSVKRSKCLPDGGEIDEVDFSLIRERFGQAVGFGKQPRKMGRSGEAREIWHAVYPDLSSGKPGLFGSVTSRAEAQVMRVAMVYALLDSCAIIGTEHLRAALSLWERAEDSARFIFGDSLGDPVADELISALRRAGSDGMTRTQIRDLFARHKGKDQINRALGLMLEKGYARYEKQQTGGKAAEVWFSV